MKRAKSMTIVLGVVFLAIVSWAVPSLRSTRKNRCRSLWDIRPADRRI